MRCDECRFWKATPERSDGTCRVRPPEFGGFLIPKNACYELAHEDVPKGFWPITLANDYCGQFQPKEYFTGDAKTKIATPDDIANMGREDEREACAMLVETFRLKGVVVWLGEIAAAIRNRKNPPEVTS